MRYTPSWPSTCSMVFGCSPDRGSSVKGHQGQSKLVKTKPFVRSIDTCPDTSAELTGAQGWLATDRSRHAAHDRSQLQSLTNDLAVHLVQRLQHKLHEGALDTRAGRLAAEGARVLVEPNVAPQPLRKLPVLWTAWRAWTLVVSGSLGTCMHCLVWALHRRSFLFDVRRECLP